MEIVLRRMGSFFVGGRQIELRGQPLQKVFRNQDFPGMQLDINGDYIVDQAYVQFFEPVRCGGPPIILVHGGGHAGNIWERTPDDRPGWLQWFLAHGHAVYVVDNVERGRAGWCSLPGVWEGE